MPATKVNDPKNGKLKSYLGGAVKIGDTGDTPGILDALQSGYDWVGKSTSKAAQDARRIAGWMGDHPLQSVGAGTAVLAAPFTGGASLLGLAGLGAGGYAIGQGADWLGSYFSEPDSPDANVPSSVTQFGTKPAGNAGNGTLLPPPVNGQSGDPSLSNGQSNAQTGGLLPAPSGANSVAGGDLLAKGSVIDAAGPVPQQALPTPVDYSKVDEAMGRAAPQPETPEEKKIREDLAFSNLLGGLANGASGARTMGELLLGAGGGLWNADAKNKEVELRTKQGDKEAARRFAMEQADLEMKKALSKATTQKEIDEIAYKNKALIYNQGLERAKELQPKVLNANAYGVTVQTKDGIRVIDTGYTDKILKASQMKRGLGLSKSAVSLTNSKMAVSNDPVFGPFQADAIEKFQNGTLIAEVRAKGIEKQYNEMKKKLTKDAAVQFGYANTKQIDNAVNAQLINFVATMNMEEAGAAANQQDNQTGE